MLNILTEIPFNLSAYIPFQKDSLVLFNNKGVGRWYKVTSKNLQRQEKASINDVWNKTSVIP